MQRIPSTAGRNPFLQALSVLAAVVVTVVAFIFGAVLLAVVVGLIALGVLAFSVRLWWLRRKLGQRAGRQTPDGPAVIEAEYTVVDRTTRGDGS